MDRVDELLEDWSTCNNCGLCAGRKHFVSGEGSHSPGLLFLGEAPGATEDETGRPFCGSSGGTLIGELLLYVSVNPLVRALALSEENFSLDSLEQVRASLLLDIFLDNIVACRPPENRDPFQGEIAACKPRVEELIYELDPLLIVAVGKKAFEALTKKNRSILTERGKLFWAEIPGRMGPGSVVRYPLLPILHPAWLDRQPDFGIPDGWADRTLKDLLRAFKIMDILREKYWGVPLPSRVDLSARKRQ